MVFESLLVDILNRYLKPYVKKIDSSNLNIGVWNGKACQPPIPKSVQQYSVHCRPSLVYSPAGNVHLKQLELKEDVLVRRPTPTL